MKKMTIWWNKLKHMDTNSKVDLATVILLISITLLYFLIFYGSSMAPFEDAAMLMRYSKHLAEGYGIVWNIGDKPVDGATDFGFMILLSGLYKLGLELESAVKVVGLLAHLATVAIIFFLSKKYSGSRIIAASVAIFIALGPGLSYIAAYFGTTFFALSVLLAWMSASKLLDNIDNRIHQIAFPLLALVMSLIRPEGTILTILMLTGIIWSKGIKKSRPMISKFIFLFILPGLIYFIWRWQYFSYPLPNPFYKKGGGQIYPISLLESIYNVLYLSFPFILLVIGSAINIIKSIQAKHGLVPILKHPPTTLMIMLPICGFTLAWLLLSNEMNYLMRFQYPLLSLTLLATINLTKSSWIRDKDASEVKYNFPTNIWTLATVSLIGLAIFQTVRYFPRNNFADGRYEIAKKLAEYKDNGYTMAVTEAGLLPFYSQWKTVDTWGLNDQWISHNGEVTEAYLDRYKPEVIMFHAYFSPLAKANKPADDWSSMVDTLKRYAEDKHYILAATYGCNPYDTHYYYVKNDFTNSQAIINDIRSTNYTWYTTGIQSINFLKIVRD